MFNLDEVDYGDGGARDGSTSDAPTDASKVVAACKSSGNIEGDCVCAGGSTCSSQCSPGRCDVTCKGGSTCNLECKGGNCDLYCERGATCTASCGGKGGCTFHCPPGATCTTSCSGGGCETETK